MLQSRILLTLVLAMGMLIPAASAQSQSTNPRVLVLRFDGPDGNNARRAAVTGLEDDYDLEPYLRALGEVNAAEPEFGALDDTALNQRGLELRQRARSREPLDQLRIPLLALARELGRRELGQRLYDEQIVAALALMQGKLAELPTGEGKTLAAVPAAPLAALTGRGVHTVGPGEGRLACGTVGPGSMAEPAEILAAATEILAAAG